MHAAGQARIVCPHELFYLEPDRILRTPSPASFRKQAHIRFEVCDILSGRRHDGSAHDPALSIKCEIMEQRAARSFGEPDAAPGFHLERNRRALDPGISSAASLRQMPAHRSSASTSSTACATLFMKGFSSGRRGPLRGDFRSRTQMRPRRVDSGKRRGRARNPSRGPARTMHPRHGVFLDALVDIVRIELADARRGSARYRHTRSDNSLP